MTPTALTTLHSSIPMRLSLLIFTLIVPLLSQGSPHPNSLDKLSGGNDKQSGNDRQPITDKQAGNDKQQINDKQPGGNDKQPGNDKPLQQNVPTADNQDQPSQSSPRPTNSSDSKGGDSNSKGLYIALGVVGGIIVLAIFSVWIFRKLKMKKPSESLSRSKTMNIHNCGIKPTMLAPEPQFAAYKVENVASYEVSDYCESVVVGPYYGNDSAAAYENGAYYPDPSYNYDQSYNPNYYQEQGSYGSYNNH